MEPCNDNEQHPPPSPARDRFVAGSGASLLSAAADGYGDGGGYGGYGSTSRPITSSGLVSSASALHIFIRTSSSPGQPSPPPQHQFTHQHQHQHHQQQLGVGNGSVSPTIGGAGNGAAGAGGDASQEFRGGGVYPASFRVIQQHQQQSGSSGDAYAPVSPYPSSASHASTPTPPLSAGGVLSSSISSKGTGISSRCANLWWNRASIE